MASPRVSLEQWRALLAVVEHGGYAQAAVALSKSQSAISHAIQKLEQGLGVQAFEIQGRKAVLTDTGRMLERRARVLVEDATALERAAKQVSAGWESEIRVAAEIIVPTRLLIDAFDRFGRESPATRIELVESVMAGGTEALEKGEVDLALTPHLPPGRMGEAFMTLAFLAVAHPDHALHRLGRPLELRDLRRHRRIVVRETSAKRGTRVLAGEAGMRWTVGQMSTSIEAVTLGHGYAFYPIERIRHELDSGQLKALPLREGAERRIEVYLQFADREAAGPGTLRLAQILRECVRTNCPGAEPAVTPSPKPRPARRPARKL